MKKLYKSKKYKTYNLRHARKLRTRYEFYKLWRIARNGSVKKKEHYNRVIVPSDFRFLGNHSVVVDFINELHLKLVNEKSVFVDMKSIELIDDSAIVVLLSVMTEFRIKGIKFNGNFPSKSLPLSKLIKSGFVERIKRGSGGLPAKPDFTYGKEDSFYTNAHKIVVPELGSTLMSNTSKTIWGKDVKIKGLQRIFIELMQNTNNHAAKEDEEKRRWWLSVNHNVVDKIVSFVFVDYGMGIFENLKSKVYRNTGIKVYDKIKRGLSGNASIMEKLLTGEIHETVTGKSYRGKGIPGVVEVAKRRHIQNLRIITNDVIVDYDNGICTKNSIDFHGTFFYWEVSEESGYTEWKKR